VQMKACPILASGSHNSAGLCRLLLLPAFTLVHGAGCTVARATADGRDKLSPEQRSAEGQLNYAARAAPRASYSCCDWAGSRTHRVYTPTAVPKGTLNSEMKPKTSATTRAQGSCCINPHPAMNPQAALARTKIPVSYTHLDVYKRQCRYCST